MLPTDITYLTNYDCDPLQQGLDTLFLSNQYGCDSIVITQTFLLESDTTVLNLTTCEPAQAGVFEQHYLNADGCDSLVITEVILLPGDTTYLYAESCLPADTGLVVNTFTNQYGCDSLVLFYTALSLPSACQLEATLQGDTIGCEDETGNLSFIFYGGQPPYTYSWTNLTDIGTGSGTSIDSNVLTTLNLPPGTYLFEATDAAGFSFSDTTLIFQPAPLAVEAEAVSDYQGFDISCHGEEDGQASVVVLGGGLPPYSFSWSTGATGQEISSLPAGWVSVTVSGSLGCMAVDSVFLEQPDSLHFELEVAQPDCFSDGLGAIQVLNPEGGTMPYWFSLNDGERQESPLFEHLESGSYWIVVEDANQCEALSLTALNSYVPLTVSLGNDTLLSFGDSLLLHPISNLPLSLLDSIIWQGVSCQGCPEVVVAPVLSSSYVVTISDSLGCEASDKRNVIVEKDFGVYAPNAFSPNNDGINDFFTLFGDARLVNIKSLYVFSRWGEPVYQIFNLPPNMPSLGWDGSYRGKPMNAGVFAWYAELEFADGSLRIVKGSVHLIR